MSRKKVKKSTPKSSKVARKLTVAPAKTQAGTLYFNPNDSRNIGRFRPQFTTNNLVSTDKAINVWDRRQLVGISRSIFASMGQLAAASKAKASWVVSNGFDPVYNSANKQWEAEAQAFLKNWYLICNTKGLSYDFKSSLKIVSRLLDRDGDIGCAFTQTVNGYPNLTFIETQNIAQRNFSNGLMQGGKYDGYKIVDGVIQASNGRPLAYTILGATEDDDTILTTQQMTLIMDAEFFDLPRGLPILSPSEAEGLNWQEIIFYISQCIKRLGALQIVEWNEQGRAPTDDTLNFAAFNETSNGTTTPAPPYNPIPLELVQDGKAYLKANSGERLEAFQHSMPAEDTQGFIRDIEKRLFAVIGWFHELMLSPDNAGGASMRSLQEMVKKNIQDRQHILERFAKTAIIYALSTAMENGIISTNYDEDFTDWSFTKGKELSVDQGYAREADRADYLLGILSLDDITRKNGKTHKQVADQTFEELDYLLTKAEELQKKHPQTDFAYCVQLARQSTANPVAPIMDNGNSGEPPTKEKLSNAPKV